jgi:hypothetical protein
MTPLQIALDDLSRLGYESKKVGSLSSSGGDSYHVYAIGKNLDLFIVRESKDGSNYRFYLPTKGDLGQQIVEVARWLDKAR